MSVTFDPGNRRIVIDDGVTSVSARSIYSRWKEWVQTQPQYEPAFRVVGGDPIGGGLFVASYFFLINGWRVRPYEGNHTLVIDGNLIVDGGGVPVVQTIGNFNVSVQLTVPVQAQGISTSGSTGPTAADIWSHPSRTLTSSGTGGGATLAEIESSTILAKEATVLSRASQTSVDNLSISAGGLTPNQATMLLEMYELLGLDPTKPLVVTETSRTVGSINQTILTDTSQTIITRNV